MSPFDSVQSAAGCANHAPVQPPPPLGGSERLAQSIDRLTAAIERLLERLPAPAPVPSPPESPFLEPTPEEIGLPTVRELLESKGLCIQGFAVSKEEERPLLQLAWYLGTRYGTLRELLHKIKRAMNNGLHLSHDLAGLGSDDLSTNCQFASLARDQGLLADFRYVRSPRRVLLVTCSRDPNALNFFSGSWLELYLEESLRRARPGIVEVRRGMRVSLPTGEDFELDIVAKDRAGRLLWVEAKTGEYSGSLPKYERVRRILDLPADRAILVLPEANAAVCESLRLRYGLWALNLGGWSQLVGSVATGASAPTNAQASSSK
ncbi:MAG: hypothetical protein ACK41F_08160 [Fimbriimonadaceae bacterium]